MLRRRFSSFGRSNRSHMLICGKIDPAASNAVTRLRRCVTYAFPRFGCSTTLRAWLSVSYPGQVSVTLPVSRLRATSVAVKNSVAYSVFSSPLRARPRVNLPAGKVRTTLRAATSISLMVPG